jgi:hypothetical protein
LFAGLFPPLNYNLHSGAVNPYVLFCVPSINVEVFGPINFCLDIFRQYMGFLEMRLVNKGSNKHLCFVDFATPAQAFFAMRNLQGEYNPFFLYSFLSLAVFVRLLSHFVLYLDKTISVHYETV